LKQRALLPDPAICITPAPNFSNHKKSCAFLPKRTLQELSHHNQGTRVLTADLLFLMTYSNYLFLLLNSQIMIRRHLNTNIFSTPRFRLLDTFSGDLGSMGPATDETGKPWPCWRVDFAEKESKDAKRSTG
jgi:hypothetical protein